MLSSSWDGRPFGHNRHGLKIGGCAPFGGGKLSLHLAQCGLGRGLSPYQVASWSIQPFGHNRHGPKIERLCPPFREEGAGSPSNTISLGPTPTSLLSGISIHPAVWPQQLWAENWGLCLFEEGSRRGALSPSNTMWPGPRPTCMSSFILIHPTVWP